jgi:hypothetical protein
LVDYFIDNLDVKEKNSILKVKKSWYN